MSTEAVSPQKHTWIRVLRAVFAVIALVVTLIALVYAVENFRGKRAWERYRADAEKRGVRFDFQSQIPAPVPDEQNGANISLIQAWFDPRFRASGDPAQWPETFERANALVASDKDKTKRRLQDLVTWQQALAVAETNDSGAAKAKSFRPQTRRADERAAAATNVLLALQAYEPALAQLREAMKRPHMRYPVQYDTEQPFSILLPHLGHVRRLTQFLSLKASAHLAAGQPDAAAQDVLMGLWVVDSLRDEHFLISYLVRIACLQVTAQPIWEGMVQQKWSDAHLQAIQERAGTFNFLLGLKHALDTERAAGITTIDWIKAKQSAKRFQALTAAEPDPAGAGSSLMTLMPRGWWDLEKVNYARVFAIDAEPLAQALQSGSLADATEMTAIQELRRGIGAVWRHEVMAGMLLPALGNVQRKAAMSHALTTEIVVSCAIDRARIASGKYPESLDALTPRFLKQLPNDVMTGKPLVYREENNGYVLYSVGWNRTDDAGAPGKTLFDDSNGDWTWRVEPVATEFE